MTNPDIFQGLLKDIQNWKKYPENIQWSRVEKALLLTGKLAERVVALTEIVEGLNRRIKALENPPRESLDAVMERNKILAEGKAKKRFSDE